MSERDAVSTLKHDHTILRTKLALLDSALQVAPEARFVLREMCFSLLRMLQEHMRREAQALERTPQTPFGRNRVRRQTWDHAAEQAHLRVVGELLLGGMKASTPAVVTRLSQAIEQLEAHMTAQEQLMFPSLEEEQGVEARPAAIAGAMSVNEILQRYPQTERIFEQLHINRWRDGYESLDEVAWRLGMDVAQVLEQLQLAVTSP